jgi:hypothetical protein
MNEQERKQLIFERLKHSLQAMALPAAAIQGNDKNLNPNQSSNYTGVYTDETVIGIG